MSRVLVVGVGRPSFDAGREHNGPGLRCGHFATALARAGHEVLVVSCRLGAGGQVHMGERRMAEVGGARVAWLEASEAAFESDELRERLRAFEPQAVVGVTVYAASVALRLRLDVPFWVDVFGDFMAEAQAKAQASANDAVIARFWQALTPVLERGDRFSCVSRAQRWALIGQLGLSGRLSSATAFEPLVALIPCAAEASQAGTRDPVLRGKLVPKDAFLALWSGSFNTWCDIETLFYGLEQAMRRDDRVFFASTGGAVAGHDEKTYRRFADLVASSPLRERFHLLGWIAGERALAAVREADVGIVTEQPLIERQLGSENRVAGWLAEGLPCVTTACSELGRTAVSRGLAFGVPPGDARRLAQRLAELAAEPERLAAAARTCRVYAAEQLGYQTTAAPLIEWSSRPDFARDRRRRPAVTVGLLSEPASMARLLEGYLAELPLPELLFRSARWGWRRLRLGWRRGAVEKRRRAD